MRSIVLPAVLLLGLVACSPSAAPSDQPSPFPTATPSDQPSPPPSEEPTAAPLSPTPSSPTGSPGLGLNEGPAMVACDAIGVDYTKVRFDIDPNAADPVTGYTDSGHRLQTLWAPGFRLGAPAERAVHGPDGAVIVKDGDVLGVGDRLGGYFVCFSTDRLFVATQDPA